MNKHFGKTVARDGTCNNLDNARNRMQIAKIKTLIILFLDWRLEDKGLSAEG
jgi:hypothetical protein